jgi:hypothetical protein
MNDLAIWTEELVKTYPEVRAVDGLNMNVPRGVASGVHWDWNRPGSVACHDSVAANHAVRRQTHRPGDFPPGRTPDSGCCAAGELHPRAPGHQGGPHGRAEIRVMSVEKEVPME